MAGLLRWLVCCFFLHGTSGYTGDDVRTLMTQLFTTNAYNNKVRPIDDQNNTLRVQIEFILNSVIEFDEQAEVLKTSGYLYLQWFDYYLQWTPSSHNYTDKLFVPQDDVWKPDISLRNTYKTFKGLGSSYLNVVVDSSGYVTWYPFQILESTCAVDIKHFPFDKQLCNMKFTAWSYQQAEIDLFAGTQGVLLEEFSPNAQWDLTDTTYIENDSGEASVTFQIELTRKSSFYVLNVILPVILLSILNICTFLLPVSSGEKAGYSITVFLSLAVFLTIISSELPKNSDAVSLMSVYLILMSSLSTIIVVICLVQIRLSVRTSASPINRAFLLLVKLSRIMRCKTFSKKIEPENESFEKEKENIDDSFDEPDWVDVNDAIDVVCFGISFLFTFLCTTIIFGVAVNN